MPQSRILIVDDEKNIVRSLTEILTDEGYEVTNTEDLFLKPQHDYTKELLHLMPKIESIYK